jgi:tetratricopeptide (TPR) repeat protein
VRSGQLDAAEPLLVRAIASDDTGVARKLLGRIALQQGRIVEAITHFDASLSQTQSASAMAGRARAKQRGGDLGGAAADYDAAVRLDGTLSEARAGRCWLDLNEERNLERARTDAEAAVAADPHNSEAQLCRGVLQLRGGEWANARTSFETVLSVEPGNPVALFGRGIARRRSGDNDGREDMNLARDFDRHIGEQFDDMGVETY